MGGDSAQSGQISDSNETWMETEVEGAGTFKFWWKVSSESGADCLEFYIDDQLQSGSISGTTSWAEKTYNLGTGSHTLKWRYVKNGSDYAGEDCGWVDHVQWSEPIAEPATDAWTTLTYTYDAGGRRIEKRYDDTLVLRYIYDGDHCIAEYDSANNLRRKYIFGPGVDQPICMIDAPQDDAVYYYHFDGLNSVVALTNEDADVVQVYEYSIYGQVGATDANHPNRFMFTGREFDKETGLYYYRARYYNAEIGRFLQTDPIGYGDGMNPYRYCGNNPVVCLDASGCETGVYPGIGIIGDQPMIAPISPDAPVILNVLGVTLNWGKPDYPAKDGEQWSITDFFGWYAHGGGDAVDLAQVGLLDDFTGSSRESANISGFTSRTESEAEARAIAAAESLLRKDATSWAVSYSYDASYDYDFAPGSKASMLWQVITEDTLMVLGSGSVGAHVSISAVNLGWGALWYWNVGYLVNDSFSNPSDIHDDPAIPDREWAGCTAYAITAQWSASNAGIVTQDKQNR